MLRLRYGWRLPPEVAAEVRLVETILADAPVPLDQATGLVVG